MRQGNISPSLAAGICGNAFARDCRQHRCHGVRVLFLCTQQSGSNISSSLFTPALLSSRVATVNRAGMDDGRGQRLQKRKEKAEKADKKVEQVKVTRQWEKK